MNQAIRFAVADLSSYIVITERIKASVDKILAKGIEMNAANAIIIKPNQIGSLSETYATVKLAKENDIVPVVSHRSGETTDATIAHLAVGFGSPMIKTGAIGGERIAKLNELIRIEEELPNPKMGEF